MMCLACSAAAASPPDVVGEAGALLKELGNPKYARSRCMLAPVLAVNGRVVVKDSDVVEDSASSFQVGDVFVAVNDEDLEAHSGTALIDRLERIAPAASVDVRLLRDGHERTVRARCTDAKPYYETLRQAAQAAVAGDGASCADALDAADRLHGLSSVWLRLSMSCKIASGRLSGNGIWRADFELYRQLIEESQYTPALLERIRHGVRGAVVDLRGHGNAPLADRLEKIYAAALAAHAGVSRAQPDDP